MGESPVHRCAGMDTKRVDVKQMKPSDLVPPLLKDHHQRPAQSKLNTNSRLGFQQTSPSYYTPPSSLYSSTPQGTFPSSLHSSIIIALFHPPLQILPLHSFIPTAFLYTPVHSSIHHSASLLHHTFLPSSLLHPSFLNLVPPFAQHSACARYLLPI